MLLFISGTINFLFVLALGGGGGGGLAALQALGTLLQAAQQPQAPAPAPVLGQGKCQSSNEISYNFLCLALVSVITFLASRSFCQVKFLFVRF